MTQGSAFWGEKGLNVIFNWFFFEKLKKKYNGVYGKN